MRLSRDVDVEMADLRPKADSWAQGSVLSTRGGASAYYHDDRHHREHHRHPSRLLRRWLDSFRRDPGLHVTPASAINAVDRRSSREQQPPQQQQQQQQQWRPYFDMHAANVNTANTLLSRELKSRHLQMIAIGGSIGRQCPSQSGLEHVYKRVGHLARSSNTGLTEMHYFKAPAYSWRLARPSTPAARRLY
jgi:amino acid transporter